MTLVGTCGILHLDTCTPGDVKGRVTYQVHTHGRKSVPIYISITDKLAAHPCRECCLLQISVSLLLPSLQQHHAPAALHATPRHMACPCLPLLID